MRSGSLPIFIQTAHLNHSLAFTPTFSFLEIHTMFSRVALLTIASMAILAAGSPTSAQSCNGGAIQCCTSIRSYIYHEL